MWPHLFVTLLALRVMFKSFHFCSKLIFAIKFRLILFIPYKSLLPKVSLALLEKCLGTNNYGHFSLSNPLRALCRISIAGSLNEVLSSDVFSLV